jgi:ubiquinone/menaquinone biosynthesis C-methylase UbiE
MAQRDIWEKEYLNPQLVTRDWEPQKQTKKFFKWLRKDQKLDMKNMAVLDLGCGTGRNSIYLAENGATVTGYDISPSAIKMGQKKVQEVGVIVTLETRNIGEKYPLKHQSIDVVMDIIASNSLTDAERRVYISEMYRILKPGGYVYVKGLWKEGDKNAKNLIKKFPGSDPDTYIMPGLHLCEKVFDTQSFQDWYQGFDILMFQTRSGYAQFQGKSYKRNYFDAYLKKTPPR